MKVVVLKASNTEDEEIYETIGQKTMPEPHNYLVVLDDSTTYEDMEITNMNKESRSNIILVRLKTELFT